MYPEELDEGLLNDLEGALQEPVNSSGQQGQLKAGGEDEMVLGSLTEVSHKEVLLYVILVQV